MPVWWISLFNPPPLVSLTPVQKAGRAFFVTLSLVVSCILLAMAAALMVFVVEKGRAMLISVPQLVNGLEIIFVSVFVNIICIFVLLQIRKSDRKLLNASDTKEKP